MYSTLRQGMRILEFWWKQKKIFPLCCWLNEECPKHFSSLGIDQRQRRTMPLWNSSGEKYVIRASLYVWYLQYWTLYDDLVVFKLWAGVGYLFFSIDTAPGCILWKGSREPRSLRASRDGYSSSSSILPTPLVFLQLLQVQQLLSSELSLSDYSEVLSKGSKWVLHTIV